MHIIVALLFIVGAIIAIGVIVVTIRDSWPRISEVIDHAPPGAALDAYRATIVVSVAICILLAW